MPNPTELGRKPYEVLPEVNGTIIGVRKIQNNGRIQIPKVIRLAIKLVDGDCAYWIKGDDGKYHIIKAEPLK